MAAKRDERNTAQPPTVRITAGGIVFPNKILPPLIGTDGQSLPNQSTPTVRQPKIVVFNPIKR